MLRLPILSLESPRPDPAELRRAERLVAELQGERPELAVRPDFRALMPDRLTGEPSLHVDDFSEIPLLDRDYDPTFLQDRARLRAEDGDLVASGTAANEEYERYCEQRLGLGHVTWLRPRGPRRALGLAASCWTDRAVRHDIVRAARTGALRYLHPHMGSFHAWALAHLLARTSRQRIEVIAPPPGLCRFVNDKLRFADTVRRLLGPSSVPATTRVANLAALAFVVRQLVPHSRSVVVKVPDSAGGHGNLVLRARGLRRSSIGGIRKRLRRRLRGLPWGTGDRLLVGAWEAEVLCTPSAQLWIPPPADGPPHVEGVFLQSIEGADGAFRGSVSAPLPAPVERRIVERSWLLGLVFQRLGYVGRCSFDTILVGPDLAQSRLQFIECNGRWGGTSGPMTLVNRLIGDFHSRPYAARHCRVPGVDRLRFADVLEHFDADLFDVHTGTGWLVLYGPGRMAVASGVDAIAFGDSWEQALERARDEVPERLRELVASSR